MEDKCFEMEQTKFTTISYVYRDSSGNILKLLNVTIGDHHDPSFGDFGDDSGG